MRKAYRNCPLSEEEIKTNHTISRMRGRVKHVFDRMAYREADLCRSMSLKHLCNLSDNMDCYALLPR